MPSRMLTLAVTAAVALIIGACGPAAPATPGAPADTPLPTQVTGESPAPADTPEPADTPAAGETPGADTPAPGGTPAAGSLQEMLPAMVGGVEMNYLAFQPGMLGEGFPGLEDDDLQRVLAEFNASASDIEVVVGSSQSGVITAVRIRGVPGEQLLQTMMADQLPEMTQTTVAGRPAWRGPVVEGVPPYTAVVAADAVINLVMTDTNATEVVQQLP